MAIESQANYYDSIIEYYDTCEFDYKMLWRLDRCLAMHYGYWDETTTSVSEALVRENVILAERAGIQKEHKVLDAGCGVGGSSIFLAQNIGCEVTGITLSQEQVNTSIANAKERGVADLTQFEAKDYCNTGYEDNSFDIVWAVESVCHAPEKAAFVKEAARILKPGGKLIIADFWASKDEYQGDDKRVMDEWVWGWQVHALETSDNFRRYLSEAKMKELSFEDATENVRPSAKRLHNYAKWTLWGAKILEWLHIRSKIQHGNVIAVHRANIALEKGLWHYGIICAQKPE